MGVSDRAVARSGGLGGGEAAMRRREDRRGHGVGEGLWNPTEAVLLIDAATYFTTLTQP